MPQPPRPLFPNGDAPPNLNDQEPDPRRVEEFLDLLQRHAPNGQLRELKEDGEIFAAFRDEIRNSPELSAAFNNLFPGAAEALDVIADAYIPWDLEERDRLIRAGEGYPSSDKQSPVKGAAISPVAFVKAAEEFQLDGSTVPAPAPFLHYFPDHAMLTDDQRATYAAWKTQSLDNAFLPVPDSYLFLHVFELINGIGWDDPGECATRMATLWSVYQPTSPAVRVLLWNWIEDFLYVNRIEDGIQQFRAAVTPEQLTGPFSDAHVDFYVESGQLFRMPIELMEAIAQVDLDAFEAVKQDEPVRFFDLLPLALHAVDFVLRLAAESSGFFQRYGPKGKHRPERPAFAGAPYAGKPVTVRLPPVASYFDHAELQARMRALMEHVDYELCVQLGLDTTAFGDFEADPAFSLVSGTVQEYLADPEGAALGGLGVDDDELEAAFAIDSFDLPGGGPPIQLFPDNPAADPFFFDEDDEEDEGDFDDDDVMEAEAEDWENFWGDLSRLEQQCLQTMTTNMFPLSKLRSIAREENESLNHILNGLNQKSMAFYGEPIVYTGSKQPVVMPSFLPELHATLAPEDQELQQ
jgi:hypothetical protein